MDKNGETYGIRILYGKSIGKNSEHIGEPHIFLDKHHDEKAFWWKNYTGPDENPGGHPTLFVAVSVDDRPEAKSEIHVLCWWSICLQNPGNLSAMDWLKGKSNLWLYPHYRGLIMDYGGVPCKISINLAARPKWSMIQVPPFLAQRFQVLSRWTRAFPEWPRVAPVFQDTSLVGLVNEVFLP